MSAVDRTTASTGPRSAHGSIFLTGATGFLGRRVAARLAGDTRPLITLSRSGDGATLRGDVANPDAWQDSLRGCDTVLHLAAATGKAGADEHWRVNAEGTRALLAAARQHGVRRFVFVSSIAAAFPDTRNYPYAQSKIAAESAVRESGLEYVIVRPTMILGRGSPILDALRRLARAPIMPVFGGGRVRVQPIAADDAARLIVAIADDASFRNETIAIGGPERPTLRELLERIRMRELGRRGPALSVPIAPLLPVLGLAERIVGNRLPFTVGQLATFRFDGTARPDARLDRIAETLATIGDMLDEGCA